MGRIGESPVTQALVEDAGIGTENYVPDIATGPGEPALSLARLVGLDGKVVGINSVTEMVAASQRATHREGLRFEVGFAERLPFADEA